MANNKIYRLLDAAANRACEAVRVVEDVVRFVFDDRLLTSEWKQFRHDLVAVLRLLPNEIRVAIREAEADVGATLSLPTEQKRDEIADLVAANVARLQQSLRSLEEGAKLVDADLALQIESLRYHSYTLSASTEQIGRSIQQLGGVRLYAIIGGGDSRDTFGRWVNTLLEAKVRAVQLRDKSLEDAELLDRAQLLVEKARGRQMLTIINDRPDIAVLAGADGVHVGQGDLGVKEVRQIIGPNRLVGVSTHSVDQLRRAVFDGANYAGIGPVFPSVTKSFARHEGLDLVRQVANETTLPLFAIGGINPENVVDVMRAGVRRCAVASAITQASDPKKVVVRLKELLRDCEQSELQPEKIMSSLPR